MTFNETMFTFYLYTATPCPELRVPGNGAKVCNGWKTDMASLCLVFCAGDRSLPFGSDHRQWWVCGAHGAWIPSSPLPDCAGITFCRFFLWTFASPLP